MSLEQEDIDYLIRKEEERRQMLSLAESAKAKLRTMFSDLMGMDFEGILETKDDLEYYLSLMDFEVKSGWQYYEDYNRFKTSFYKKFGGG